MEGKMVTQTQQTVKQWLEELASNNESSDIDSGKMQNLLHRVGFASAVVTCGIVYLEGHGTMDAPPTDLHSIARMLLKVG